jgi:hypothetical protein
MKHIYCLLLYGFSICAAPAQLLSKWNYPCKPGTDCWRSLTNVAERQAACQIKGVDPKSIPTEELLLILMEHPFFQSYLVHDSPVEGLRFALGDFNGFVEFQLRADAMKTLSRLYLKEDFNKLKIMSDTSEMGAYTLKWIGIELIMTNGDLLRQLTSQEKIDFLKQLYFKLQEKEKYSEIFGGISDAASACIFYKVLKSMGYDDFGSAFGSVDAEELFRKKLIVRNTSTVDKLLGQFAEFIRKN